MTSDDPTPTFQGSVAPLIAYVNYYIGQNDDMNVGLAAAFGLNAANLGYTLGNIMAHSQVFCVNSEDVNTRLTGRIHTSVRNNDTTKTMSLNENNSFLSWPELLRGVDIVARKMPYNRLAIRVVSGSQGPPHYVVKCCSPQN